MTTPPPPRTPRRRVLLLGGLGALVAVGAPVAATRWGDWSAGATLSGTTDAGRTASAVSASASGTGLFTADRLHEVVLDVTDAQFRTALSTFQESGEKTWLEVGVTLDGTTYERAGLRLKGNSTLRRADTGAGAESYPWLVRLDKVVDGQNHGGVTEVVIRVNNSASSLNEVVSLDLLGAAALASEQHAYAAIRVGDASALRVVLESPGDTWAARTMTGDGLLYKAEATGDYTYRGTDPASYDQVFDQESGDDDLTPLIEFLQFVNDSSDADFASGLGERLDVESFATYLALEDLMDNYDAIDGPGNNSYLWWDRESRRMTVVGWDHNLTFGVSNRPGGGGAAAAGVGGMPGGGVPGGGAPAGGGGRGPGGRAANPLVTRFEAVADFTALETAATARLKADLYAGGVASASLERWSALLAARAGSLLDESTLATEKAAIAAYLG
ncbi:MAG TPA: CotH kinase family protein [Ornithinibacter sp.]|nr:CotH kinase family protein [Ornithinibacter sp.]